MPPLLKEQSVGKGMEEISYDADPKRWLARNADTVRQAFRRRTAHILTCSDPLESPFGTIALPGLGIQRAQQYLERLKGLHACQPIEVVRSHVNCRACAAFARESNILAEQADEAGKTFARILCGQIGAENEHSLRGPWQGNPVNNLYVDTTLCLGDPADGGLPAGFKISHIPYRSWGECCFGIDPEDTVALVRSLMDIVASAVPKDEKREPFNIVLFRDVDTKDDSQALVERLAGLGKYILRPWQRFIDAKAPHRKSMISA